MSRINVVLFGAVLMGSVLSGGMASGQSVAAAHALSVSNPAVFLAATDTLFEAEVMAGRQVAILAAEIDGANPATHYIVEEFVDYADYEAKTAARENSPAWARYLETVRTASEYLGSTLQRERYSRGGDWRQYDAVGVFNMTISDPGTFLEAFAELNEAIDNPGAVRVGEIRAGGMGATHLVAVAADGFATLNDALDETFGSAASAAYMATVRDIRSINNVSMFRRVRTYGDKSAPR